MSEYREAFRERRDVKVDFRCVSGDEGERNDPDQPENDEWRMFLLRPLNTTRNSGYICAVVDITELKTAELAQERTAVDAKDRKQQQERFIDMVSHEIRNPLSAVLHLAEEIKETSKAMEGHGPQADQIAEIIDAADTILVCVAHQSVLVDDILNFSKLDSAMMSLAPSVSQPKWALSKQLKVFQAELKNNRIGFEYALDVSFGEHAVDWVVADLARIKQVLVNLMTNAIKFTSKTNGERRITVAVGASIERPKSYPPDVVFFNDYNEDRDQTRSPEWGDGPAMYLMVAVKDTGIGISAQDQAKLFERFRQATPKTSEKYGGSGLGLSISRKLCQLHGGDIGVGSHEGQGSTFGFYFKVRRASPPADESPHDSGRTTPVRQISSEDMLSRPRLPSRPQSNRTAIGSINESAKGEGSDRERDGGPMNRTISDKPGLERERDTNPTLIKPVERVSSAFHDTSGAEGVSEPQDVANTAAQQEQEKHAPRDIVGSGLGGKAIDSCEKKEVQSRDQVQTRRTLLLVEDNLINQRVLKKQLQVRSFPLAMSFLIMCSHRFAPVLDPVLTFATRRTMASRS